MKKPGATAGRMIYIPRHSRCLDPDKQDWRGGGSKKQPPAAGVSNSESHEKFKGYREISESD